MRTASFEAGHMTAPDQVADLPFFPCIEAVVHTWPSRPTCSTECWSWDARSTSASHNPEHGSGSVRPHRRSMQQGVVRGNYPGLDVYALKADFDAFLADAEPPDDYQKAF